MSTGVVPAGDRLGGMRRTVLWAGAAGAAAGAAAMLCYRWQAFPLSLLWAGACFAVGGLVGFLFGIPRTGRRVPVAGSAGTAAAPPAVRANTNLEEVSDWVTKILIGVTLTQYEQFRLRFREAAETFARALGGEPSDYGYASAVMVGFSVGGWLFGYLLTLSSTPVLAEALTSVERLAEEVREVKAVVKRVSHQVGEVAQEAARSRGGDGPAGRRVNPGNPGS
ncbi:MAG: hypothetical protein C0501_30690 [Isosphaera sp.]|nr:hypothetical protein [Isosphaera sp.]